MIRWLLEDGLTGMKRKEPSTTIVVACRLLASSSQLCRQLEQD